MSSMSDVFSDANETAILAQVRALRETIRSQKARALENWNACIPGEEGQTARTPLGKFTEQLNNG